MKHDIENNELRIPKTVPEEVVEALGEEGADELAEKKLVGLMMPLQYND